MLKNKRLPINNKLIEGKCTFTDLNVRTNIKHKRALSGFIVSLLHSYTSKSAYINYVFANDDYVLTINQERLKHNTYTDIITFDLSLPHSSVILSDIFISIDRVKDNAHIHNVSYTNELLRVMLHGALHLCGYKDKSKKDKEAMRKAEEKYMQLFLKQLAKSTSL